MGLREISQSKCDCIWVSNDDDSVFTGQHKGERHSYRNEQFVQRHGGTEKHRLSNNDTKASIGPAERTASLSCSGGVQAHPPSTAVTDGQHAAGPTLSPRVEKQCFPTVWKPGSGLSPEPAHSLRTADVTDTCGRDNTQEVSERFLF